MSNTISNNDDVLDSRDIIARIEELESTREDITNSIVGAKEDVEDVESSAIFPTDALKKSALKSAIGVLEKYESDLRDFDESDEGTELISLHSLASEAEGYSSDWRYGVTLIRESYFEEYARELAEDLYGKEMRESIWPFTCIDWEKAAEELQTDYTSVEFDGVTYWVR